MLKLITKLLVALLTVSSFSSCAGMFKFSNYSKIELESTRPGTKVDILAIGEKHSKTYENVELPTTLKIKRTDLPIRLLFKSEKSDYKPISVYGKTDGSGVAWSFLTAGALVGGAACFLGKDTDINASIAGASILGTIGALSLAGIIQTNKPYPEQSKFMVTPDHSKERYRERNLKPTSKSIQAKLLKDVYSLMAQGQYQDYRMALNETDELLKTNNTPLLHHLKGQCYQLLNDNKNAIKSYETALSLANSSGDDWLYEEIIKAKLDAENKRAIEKKENTEAWMGILSLTAGIASQVASGVAEQTQPQKEAMADEFYGLTMDEYLNPSKISKEKLDKLIDPRMAIAKQNAIEQSYYDEFRRHCKKPDGSDYSYMEYKYLLYLQEQESGGDSIFDRGVNEDDEEMEEQEDAEEQDEKSGTFYEEYHGTDISSQGYSSASTTTKNKSKTEEASKLKNNQQFKTGKVDDKDYEFQKKVQLFWRNGSKATRFCVGELYKKGAYEYVKIGGTYFASMYSNWSKFSKQIVYGHRALYYN